MTDTEDSQSQGSEAQGELRVVARLKSDRSRFTQTTTIEELLSLLTQEFLPVDEVYVQVLEGQSVHLVPVGILRVEYIPHATQSDGTPTDSLPAPVDPPQELSVEEIPHEQEEEQMSDPEPSGAVVEDFKPEEAVGSLRRLFGR